MNQSRISQFILSTDQLRLLQVLAVCLFTARAWQHLRWESPLVTQWGWSTPVMVTLGIFWLLAALLSGGVKKFNRPLVQIFLITGALSLLVLTIAIWQARSFQPAQFIEHSIQWTLPLVLLYLLKFPSDKGWFILGLKIVIALTYLGHGMYAVGIYSIPPTFVEMTGNILGLNEDQAIFFLLIAGILDLMVVIGIFLPGKERIFLYYAMIWGTLTALARLFAYFDFLAPLASFDRWFFEVLLRLGHGGIPLLLYLILEKDSNNSYTYKKSQQIPH